MIQVSGYRQKLLTKYSKLTMIIQQLALKMKRGQDWGLFFAKNLLKSMVVKFGLKAKRARVQHLVLQYHLIADKCSLIVVGDYHGLCPCHVRFCSNKFTACWFNIIGVEPDKGKFGSIMGSRKHICFANFILPCPSYAC